MQTTLFANGYNNFEGIYWINALILNGERFSASKRGNLYFSKQKLTTPVQRTVGLSLWLLAVTRFLSLLIGYENSLICILIFLLRAVFLVLITPSVPIVRPFYLILLSVTARHPVSLLLLWRIVCPIMLTSFVKFPCTECIEVWHCSDEIRFK